MPIEILPENIPDWIQFDSTAGIGFLAEDPFWKTKAGSADPEKAILFRGGLGFLDRSIDGGKTWTTVLPVVPNYPDWYVYDQQTQYDWYAFPPVPQPDPSIYRPTKSTVTYRAYAGNPAHTGEHAVLVTHVVPEGVTTDWDLATMWIVYSMDDWASAKWLQLPTDMEPSYAPVSEAGTVLIWTRPLPGGFQGNLQSMVKLGNGKYACFWRWWFTGPTYTEYHCCAILSEADGVFTVEGITEQPGSWGPDEPFVHGNDVYFIRVADVDGTPDRLWFYAYRWDCSGSTPVYDGLIDSIEAVDTSNSTAMLSYGYGFVKTVGGKIGVWGSLYHVSDSSLRDTYFAYFDCASETWGVPYAYSSGSGTPIYWYFAGISISDGDLIFLVDSDWETQVNARTIDIGSMTTYHYKNLHTDPPPYTLHYDINPYAIVRLSDARIAFNARNFGTRVVQLDMAGGYDFDLIESDHPSKQYDYGEGHYGQRPIQETPSDFVFWGTSLEYSYNDLSEPNDYFPHKLESWSEDTPGGIWVPLGSRSYGRFYSSGGDKLYVSVVTVDNDDKPASGLIESRFFIGRLGWSADGSYLAVPAADYNRTILEEFPPTHLRGYGDMLFRHPDGKVGEIGYEDWMRPGFQPFWWRWDSFDLYLPAEVASRAYSINYDPWPYAPDTVIIWGKFFTNPPHSQIWTYNENDGFKYVWRGIVDDPVQAIVYHNQRIYAALKTSTGVELWESDLPPYSGGASGDYMNYKSDSPLDDVGWHAMDVDIRDGTMVLANKVADLLMVYACPPPYTAWYNLTFSHRNDRGVTGLVVL